MVEISSTEGLPGLRPHLKQELLLALLGCGGSVFHVEACLGSSPRADLRSELDWLSAADRAILKSLVCLGSFYKTVEAWCTKQQRCSGSTSAVQLALAEGLAEVLQLYREALLGIQQTDRYGPELFPAGLQIQLQRFQTLLRDLADLVADVARSDLRGTALQRAVHTKAAETSGDVAACMLRLQWHCRQPLCKRLSAWMLYGELIGRPDEFFVSYTAAAAKTEAAQQNASSAAALGLQPQISEHADLMSFKVAVQQQHDAPGGLPPDVSHVTAHHILNIGKVAFLKRRHAASQPNVGADAGSSAGQTVLSHADAGKTLTQLMRADLFDAPKFSRFIAALWAQAAKEMWSMLTADNQLQQQLKALQAYYLAGCGDLLTSFLQQGNGLFALPPGADAGKQLPQLWQQACDLSTAAHDPLAGSFRPALARPVEPSQRGPGQGRQLFVPEYDAWDGLGLVYTAAEPINQIITGQMVQSYSKIWQLLLRLKRANNALLATWQSLKRPHVNRKNAAADPSIAFCLVQTSLAHCIDSLLRYIQTDVIETQTAKFWTDMQLVDSVSAAHKTHQLYVDAMTAHAFLDEASIMGAISSLLKLARQLHASVQHHHRAESQPDAAAQLAAVKAAARRLLQELINLQDVSLERAPHAAVLIGSLKLCT